MKKPDCCTDKNWKECFIRNILSCKGCGFFTTKEKSIDNKNIKK